MKSTAGPGVIPGDPERSGRASCPFSSSSHVDGNSTWSPCFSPPPKMKPEQKELSVSMGATTLQAGKPSFLSFCCASLEWRPPCRAPGLARSGTAVLGCTRGRQDAMRSLAPRKSSIMAGTASGRHPARAGTLLPCGVLGPQSLALPLLCAAEASQK